MDFGQRRRTSAWDAYFGLWATRRGRLTPKSAQVRFFSFIFICNPAHYIINTLNDQLWGTRGQPPDSSPRDYVGITESCIVLKINVSITELVSKYCCIE